MNGQQAVAATVRDPQPPELFTIGFAGKSAPAFFGALRDAGVRQVIDIRLNNVSQLAGFTKRHDLPFFLREICGATYLHEPQLAPTKDILDSYRSDHSWQRYTEQFLPLLVGRHAERVITSETLATPTALLCSEPTAERCHRRLVAEFLARHIGGLRITHL